MEGCLLVVLLVVLCWLCGFGQVSGQIFVFQIRAIFMGLCCVLCVVCAVCVLLCVVVLLNVVAQTLHQHPKDQNSKDLKT